MGGSRGRDDDDVRFFSADHRIKIRISMSFDPIFPKGARRPEARLFSGPYHRGHFGSELTEIFSNILPDAIPCSTRPDDGHDHTNQKPPHFPCLAENYSYFNTVIVEVKTCPAEDESALFNKPQEYTEEDFAQGRPSRPGIEPKDTLPEQLPEITEFEGAVLSA